METGIGYLLFAAFRHYLRLYLPKHGLERDMSDSGMGIRSRRYSLLVESGIVKQVNVEGPGKFEVSDAGTMLKQLG